MDALTPQEAAVGPSLRAGEENGEEKSFLHPILLAGFAGSQIAAPPPRYSHETPNKWACSQARFLVARTVWESGYIFRNSFWYQFRSHGLSSSHPLSRERPWERGCAGTYLYTWVERDNL